MLPPIILASGSAIRAEMLRKAGVAIEVKPARVDEDAIRQALDAEGATPRDLADTLAEMKARKIAERLPDRIVLGCDQVLECGGTVFSKPQAAEAATEQLRLLRGKMHRLLSAAVLYHDGRPVWRHVGQVRLEMRSFSDAYLADYVARNWPGIGESVGAYKLEEEGVRLFQRIEGDYFTILGLPLIELLGYLGQRGWIET
ncbi:MAG: septum formation protein Maf [Paracoccaceae bacterium]|nr:septum formation protein Maf [Paracoccaceae bacterium]